MTDVPPTVFRPSIDVGPAVGLLRRVEAHREAAGWSDGEGGGGGNLWVYVVYDHHDVTVNHHISRIMSNIGAPVRNSRYTAQPLLNPKLFYQNRQPEDRRGLDGLRRFALNMAYLPAAAMDDAEGLDGAHMETFRALLREPGVVGFAACYETSGFSGVPVHARAAMNAGVPLEQVRGAVDIRVAVLVDVNDRGHLVKRFRGEPAEVSTRQVRGNSTTSLRILMDVAMNRVPDTGGFHARYPDAGLRVDLA